MRTHVNLEPETVADLARDFPGIIGMKDSSGDIERIKRIIDITPGSFKVLSGDDGLILDTLLLGGTGAISGTANVIPDILVNLYGAFLEGDIKKARMLQDRIAPLRADGKLGTSPGVVKLQANLAGCPAGKCRMPIRMDDPETIETIRKNLERYYGIPTGK
jgi:4-hydroxy-tetrahydrodipicolinate synthase